MIHGGGQSHGSRCVPPRRKNRPCGHQPLLWVWPWVSLGPGEDLSKGFCPSSWAFLCTGASLKSSGDAANHYYLMSLFWWYFGPRRPGPVSHMPTLTLSLYSRTFLLTVSNVPSMHQPKPPLCSSERHVYLSFSFFFKRKLKLKGDEYLAQGHSSHVVEPEFNLHGPSLTQSPGHILCSSVPSTVSMTSVWDWVTEIPHHSVRLTFKNLLP